MKREHPVRLTRREFLASTLGAASALSVFGPATARAEESKAASAARWAFVSDPHIPGRPELPPPSLYHYDPWGNLSTALKQILASNTSAVAIDGDLARTEGTRADYQKLKELLQPLAGARDLFLGLGNHDDRDNFQAVFTEALPGEKALTPRRWVTITHSGPVRIIVLDSLLYVNKSAGLLGRSQRRWLQDYLSSCEPRPTVLCVHHPLSDGDGDLLDTDRLYAIIEHNPHVKAVLYGHTHRPRFSRRGDLHLVNLPAVGYTFDRDEPVGWLESELDAKGGRFKLHLIDGDRKRDGEETELTWR